jgi:hypothetical protein
MVTGVLLTLYGATCGIFALYLFSSESQPQFAGAVPQFMVGTALFLPGVLSIAAGAGLLGGRPWARWIGIAVSITFVVLGGLAIVGLLGSEGGASDDMPTVAVLAFLTVAYGLAAWAFISARPYFRQLSDGSDPSPEPRVDGGPRE